MQLCVLHRAKNLFYFILSLSKYFFNMGGGIFLLVILRETDAQNNLFYLKAND